VFNEVRKINDPYPFLSVIIAELGFEVKQISFLQERRVRGLYYRENLRMTLSNSKTSSLKTFCLRMLQRA